MNLSSITIFHKSGRIPHNFLAWLDVLRYANILPPHQSRGNFGTPSRMLPVLNQRS